jgi:hypothetical protein
MTVEGGNKKTGARGRGKALIPSRDRIKYIEQIDFFIPIQLVRYTKWPG